jgi:hypothetical protein
VSGLDERLSPKLRHVCSLVEHSRWTLPGAEFPGKIAKKEPGLAGLFLI